MKVRDGVLEDPSFLPVLYCAPDNAPIDDPETWLLANPNAGISPKWEFLEEDAAKALSTPGYENTFRRHSLNQ